MKINLNKKDIYVNVNCFRLIGNKKIGFSDISILFSSFLCTLVTGFTLTYAAVVMPGLSKLEDKKYIKAFQVIDMIIQNNQPIFLFIWLGSIISTICTIIVSIITLGIVVSWLIILISILYLSGVQGITVLVHLPLNKHIQKIYVDTMNFQKLSDERKNFAKHNPII